MNKYPWEQYPHIWPTKAKFMQFIRGGIRKGLWNTNPIKLEFIKDKRIRVPLGKKTKTNPEGMVWGGECNLCNNLFREPNLQVDHDIGNHSLRDICDIQEFIEKIVVFITKENLQLVCGPCHKIKSYGESHNLTFDEAKIEKAVISFSKKTPAKQKQILKQFASSEEEISNAKKRKDLYREVLKSQ